MHPVRPSSPSHRRPKVATWLFVLVAVVLAFGLQGRSIAQTPDAFSFSVSRAGSDFAPLTAVPDGAQVVTVGLYVNNAYDLNISSNTYYLSGYLWFRWRGDFDPIGSLDFSNGVETWGMTASPLYEEPLVLGDGSHYQLLLLQGRFYHPFDLRDYPLDTQHLVLVIENSEYTVDAVTYVPDAESTGFAKSLVVPGWSVNSLTAQSFVHDYRTTFGDTTPAVGTKYSTVSFAIQLTRVPSMFIWRLLLPMVLVLLTNWLALTLKPSWVEVRTAMPATALLTLVFMQQSSLNAIPQVSTLVLMDQIYILAYICVVATLGLIIWINTHLVEGDAASEARMKRIDWISLVVQALLFAVGFAILVSSAVASGNVHPIS